jgi:hypothetical protein
VQEEIIGILTSQGCFFDLKWSIVKARAPTRIRNRNYKPNRLISRKLMLELHEKGSGQEGNCRKNPVSYVREAERLTYLQAQAIPGTALMRNGELNLSWPGC